MKEARTEVCPACDGAHSIYQCTTFGAWTVDRRHGLVRRKHLCLNCLGSNHSIEACTSRCTVRECSQKHHMLLHRLAANSRPADTTDFQQSAFNSMFTPSHSPEPVEASVSLILQLLCQQQEKSPPLLVFMSRLKLANQISLQLSSL